MAQPSTSNDSKSAFHNNTFNRRNQIVSTFKANTMRRLIVFISLLLDFSLLLLVALAVSMFTSVHAFCKGVYTFVEWLWYKMAFLKRKRVKFSVDLQVCHLSDVPLVNAVLFAKVRLLEGGSFQDNTERVEVVNHSATWTRRFNFICRISSDPATGILERCPCRISIRKEQKGGKSYVKLGYVDINLSEFAASGVEGLSRAYLLDGYGQNQRQDNSKVLVKMTMCHQSADPFFKVFYFIFRKLMRNSQYRKRINLEIASNDPHMIGIRDDADCSLNPEERRAPKGESEECETTSISAASDHTAGSASNGSTVAFRNHGYEVQDTNSTALERGEDAVSVASDSRRAAVVAGGVDRAVAGLSNSLRRLSQDRSNAPRVLSTRIDAEGVIASVLAGSRISEDVTSDGDASQGLSLYVGRDGEAMIAPPAAYRSLFERVHVASDTNAGNL